MAQNARGRAIPEHHQPIGTRPESIQTHGVEPADAGERRPEPRPRHPRQEDVEHPLERAPLGVDVLGEGEQVGREEDAVDRVGVTVIGPELRPDERPGVALAVHESPVRFHVEGDLFVD